MRVRGLNRAVVVLIIANLTMKYLFNLVFSFKNFDLKKFFCKNSLIRIACLFFASLSICSCESIGKNSTAMHELNVKSIDKIAEKNGFKKEFISGGKFIITTYSKVTNTYSPDYVIYIEGDGNVTRFGGTPSANPTPKNHMTLNLAFKDKRENVIYIARPCQYTPMRMNPACTTEYWTNKRWSEDSVDNINNVINLVAAKAKNIHLVGFSGGGGIAILVAAKNKKVKDIITIAGNLDVEEFVKYHKNIPCIGSLNPIDYAEKVKNIPQMHFVGSKDSRVPFFIADSFVRKSNSSCVKYRIIEGKTHSKGWIDDWSELLANIKLDCFNN